jgi:DNA-binding NtrC family response regulator
VKPSFFLEKAMQTSGAQNAHNFSPDGSLAPENAQFKVLVVDDMHFFSPAVQEFLANEGHQVLTAASADEAVDKTAQFQPDFILFDNEVEGALGRDMVSELLTEQPSAGLVILARHPQVSEAAAAIRQGATDYQPWPLEAAKLGELIESQKAFF